MTATRNNRRPYKAAIRAVCEEQLAASAETQLRLKKYINSLVLDWHTAVADRSYMARRLNRYRIACAGLAIVAVIGWAL